MTAQEFATYQEQTFDSYVKRLIRNESADAKRELARRAKREIQLSALSPAEISTLTSRDKYHPEQVTLLVRDHKINILDPDLGQALSFLSPKWRDVLLLHYFLGESDTQISARLNMTPGGVRHRRKVALSKLRCVLEAMEHGD